MNKEEYKIMYELEDTHWWCAGMRRFCFGLLDKFYNGSDRPLVLDAGCGTGVMLEHFERYGPTVGVDISGDAIGFCRLRGHKRIIRASVTDLPFANDSFGLIAALVVICQLQVKDDLKTLREYYRVLKESGRIVISAPAYEFLKSEHDEAVHTRHRYTADELKAKVEQAGFKIEKISYANTFLFPPIALFRLAKRMLKPRRPIRSDLRPTPAFLNRILIFILMVEANLLKRMNLPFGLSILCVAQK